MSTRFENTALALAGFSLLVVTFTGLSLFRGRSTGDSRPERSQGITAWDEFVEPESGATRQAGLGLMDAWRVPAPFSADELEALVDELLRAKERAEAWGGKLDEREIELELQRASLEEREAELARLEAAAKATPPAEPRQADPEPSVTRWDEVAKLLASVPVDEAKGLLALYEPEDAAAILHAVGNELVEAELLASLRTVPSLRASWKSYVDAYSILTEQSSD